MINLIQEQDLMDWTGFTPRDALINWLRQHGIPYLLGREGRVCCTTDAVNLPFLRVQQHNANTSEDIKFS